MNEYSPDWLPGEKHFYAGNYCYQKCSRLVIDEGAIAHNVAQIRSITKKRIIAVIKENGYGLGLLNEYRILEKQGLDFFAVTNTKEALSLREFGCQADILMLTPILEREEAAALLEKDIVMTLHDMDQADMLCDLAAQTGLRPRVHIKIDTGMGRYGFLYNHIPDFTPYKEALSLEGCYSHLAGKAQNYKKHVDRQVSCFRRALSSLKAQGIEPALCHICNSKATMTFGDLGFDAVRTGTALIGKCAPRRKLKEAVWLEAPVSMTLFKEKGATISYQSQAVLKRDSKLALLRIGHGDGVGLGYTDGSETFLEQLFWVAKKTFFPGRYKMYIRINGKKLEVLGRLGIAHMMVDITGTDVEAGDIAKLSVNPLLIQPFVKRQILPIVEEVPSEPEDELLMAASIPTEGEAWENKAPEKE